MATLDRVLDPSTLDACAGARAKLAVDVPAAWLDEGATVAITAPARLVCARCEGGGCDGCGRSGALRAPDDPAARAVEARLPARLGKGAIALRIPAPFGPDHPIAQLLVEVRAAEAASANVRRVAPPPAAAPRALSPYTVAAVLAAVAAIVAALFGR